MSQWSIKVEPFQEVIFEVLKADTKWQSFASIQATPGREYDLGGQVGDQVTVEFNTGESIVTFQPYTRDGDGKVHKPLLRSYNEPDFPRCWRLDTEAGEGVDWDDYVVRVHVVDADREKVNALRQSLEQNDCDRPSLM
jgi:hypothetical protein